jgi:hypothetical protein
MSDKKHLSESEFVAFQNDTMNQKDKLAFLEHISSCTFCSDQFASYMSKDLIPAPRDMKADILKAVNRPEIQLAIRVKETSKKMQLLIYSLKVGTATIVALLLLLLSVNLTNFAVSPDKWAKDANTAETTTETKDNEPLTSVIRDGMDAICNDILDFSNTIMRTEVTNND